jgi:hypothetical protein
MYRMQVSVNTDLSKLSNTGTPFDLLSIKKKIVIQKTGFVYQLFSNHNKSTVDPVNFTDAFSFFQTRLFYIEKITEPFENLA